MNLTVGSDATTWKFTVHAPRFRVHHRITAARLQQHPQLTGTALTAGNGCRSSACASGRQHAYARNDCNRTSITGDNRAAPCNPGRGRKAEEYEKEVRPTLDGQIGVNTQWVSGSNPPDTNTVSAAEHVTPTRRRPWHLEANGSGTLNSILNPPPMRTSHAQFSDYVLQAGKKQERGVRICASER